MATVGPTEAPLPQEQASSVVAEVTADAPESGPTPRKSTTNTTSTTNETKQTLPPAKLPNRPTRTTTSPPKSRPMPQETHQASETTKSPAAAKPKPETEATAPATDNITVEATESKPPPYSPPNVYIAVMGQTGTGKTTFISDATGMKLKIGHELDSCTQDVEEFETTIDNRIIRFIDTPGFDDSDRSDSDILELIGTYLRMAHISNIRLTGVIYLQRITDNRMQGSATRNLRLLKELCGPENYGNLVLVTTMWSRVDLAEGTRRELQLRSNNKFWGEFIRQGATVRKYEGGKESAISIVRHLLKKTPVVLKFQRELAEAGIIASTSAGEELIRDLAVMKENTKNRIEKLQQDLEKTTGVRGLLEAENKELVEKLNEKAAMEKKLEEKDKEMAEQIEKLSADLTQRMEKLQEDLKQSTKDKGALEGEIVTLREKGRKMSEEIQNLGKDLEQRIDENEELRQRVESDGQRQGRWPRCAVQ